MLPPLDVSGTVVSDPSNLRTDIETNLRLDAGWPDGKLRELGVRVYRCDVVHGSEIHVMIESAMTTYQAAIGLPLLNSRGTVTANSPGTTFRITQTACSTETAGSGSWLDWQPASESCPSGQDPRR